MCSLRACFPLHVHLLNVPSEIMLPGPFEHLLVPLVQCGSHRISFEAEWPVSTVGFWLESQDQLYLLSFRLCCVNPGSEESRDLGLRGHMATSWPSREVFPLWWWKGTVPSRVALDAPEVTAHGLDGPGHRSHPWENIQSMGKSCKVNFENKYLFFHSFPWQIFIISDLIFCSLAYSTRDTLALLLFLEQYQAPSCLKQSALAAASAWNALAQTCAWPTSLPSPSLLRSHLLNKP